MGDQSLKVKREDFQETEKDWPERWEESQVWASQGSGEKISRRKEGPSCQMLKGQVKED